MILPQLRNVFRFRPYASTSPQWNFITKAEIASGKLSDSSVNFFNTFGYIVLPGFLKPEFDQISAEFDRLFVAKFGKIKHRSYFYPQFADQSDLLIQILVLPKVLSLAESLLGPSPLYKGSDGGIFTSGSSWHRDYLNKTKSIKLLAYLEHNTANSGALRVIPGSHFLLDGFSRFLSASMKWPAVPVEGGFNERGFLPRGANPTQFQSDEQMIPNVILETRPGDLAIFNHNIVHCANKSVSKKARRLMALSFAANPMATTPEDERALDSMRELRDLTQIEVDSFKLPAAYGPAIMASNDPLILKMTEAFRDLHKKDTTVDGEVVKLDSETAAFCERFANQGLGDYVHWN